MKIPRDIGASELIRALRVLGFESARQNDSHKLRDLLKYDLKSMRALALKESFDAFWQYDTPCWAGWFLKKWCPPPCGANSRP